MIRGRYRIVLLPLLAVAVGFGLGVAWRSHKPAGTPAHAIHKAAERDGIPRVDAEIANAWASPDFSRVALALRKLVRRPRYDGECDYSVAIFDPAGKRIIANEAWYVSEEWTGKSSWSPDSQWLAMVDRNCGRDVLLINKDGRQKRILHLGKRSDSEGDLNVRCCVWRESKPHRLVYALSGVSDQVREYNVETGADRLILNKNGCWAVGLFNLRSKLCAAFLPRVRRGGSNLGRVFVVEVGSGREVVSIPLHYTTFDGMDFDMSADGKLFAMRYGESLNVSMIVGNTQDASTAFTHPWRTLLRDGGCDIYPRPRLSWHPTGVRGAHDEVAIVDSTNGNLVLGGSGGWRSLRLLPERPATFAWWKEGLFLAIDKEGLWITNNGRNLVPKGMKLPDPYKERLILRHRPISDFSRHHGREQ